MPYREAATPAGSGCVPVHTLNQHRHDLRVTLHESAGGRGGMTNAPELFELISQRYERGSTLTTSNPPFEEWTETLGTERHNGRL